MEPDWNATLRGLFDPATVDGRALIAAFEMVARDERPSVSAVAKEISVSRQALGQYHKTTNAIIVWLHNNWRPKPDGDLTRSLAEINDLKRQREALKREKAQLLKRITSLRQDLTLAIATLDVHGLIDAEDGTRSGA